MYQYQTRIRYSELDESGHLKPEALLDYFQDCSTFQIRGSWNRNRVFKGAEYGVGA